MLLGMAPAYAACHPKSHSSASSYYGQPGPYVSVVKCKGPGAQVTVIPAQQITTFVLNGNSSEYTAPAVASPPPGYSRVFKCTVTVLAPSPAPSVTCKAGTQLEKVTVPSLGETLACVPPSQVAPKRVTPKRVTPKRVVSPRRPAAPKAIRGRVPGRPAFRHHPAAPNTGFGGAARSVAQHHPAR